MDRVTRRGLLATSGVLLGAGLSGCIEGPTAGTPTPMDGATDFVWPDNARTFGTVTIGDRDGIEDPAENRPHGLHLWNDFDGERAVRIRVTEGETTRFDETQTFPRNEVLEIDLLEPGVYGVAVHLEDRVAGRFTVPRTLFDCNTSFTQIRLPPDGTIQRRTIATRIGCYPRLDRTWFVIDDRSCGEGDHAQISFDSEGVSVRGRLEVPTPCHGAVLADARVVDGGETLRLDIESTPPLPNETCVQCVGVVRYRTEVRFRERGVSTVAVHHDGTEITRTNR